MANDIRYMNLMKQRKIDAMILSLSAESMENNKIIRKELEKIDIPYIFLDRYFDGDYHKVIVDNTYGGEIVAKYLLEKGHINIGAIVGPLSLNSSRNRLEGFKKSLEKYGLSLNDNNIAYEQYNMASGYLGAEKLINNKVSAIFAFNDLQAYGVISYCKEHGIKIPEDISLVGFDDLPFSSIVDPKLTTVKQPLSELAHEACNMILSLIEKKDYDKEIKLKTQFVERESVRDMI